MRQSIGAAVLLLLVGAVSLASPVEQTFYLLDGSVVRGQLLDVTETSLVVKTSMGDLTVAKSKLQRVEFAPELSKAEAVGRQADVTPEPGAGPVPTPSKRAPFAGEVRATTDFRIASGCAYVGTVTATGLVGLREKALKARTAELGGNIVITTAGNGSGDAFFCSGSPVKVIEIVESALVKRPFKVLGFAQSKLTDASKALDEMRFQAAKQGGDALLDVAEQTATETRSSPTGWSWTGKQTTQTVPAGLRAKVIAWTDAPAASASPNP